MKIYRIIILSLAIFSGSLLIFVPNTLAGFNAGYFNNVAATPSSVERGQSVTISGNAIGAYNWVPNPRCEEGIYITSYTVDSSYYSIDSTSYNLPFSLTLTQAGDSGCLENVVNTSYTYSFSFSIKTSTLSVGSHTVYLKGTSGGQAFYSQTSFTVTLPGSITVNSKDAVTGNWVYSPCCWTITGPVTLTGEGTSVTYTNQPPGTYTLVAGPRPTGYQDNPTISPAATQTLTTGGEIIFDILWQPIPPPTVSIAADPSTIYLGQPSTLTWSSTNATSCTASGAWSGSKPLSGSEVVTPPDLGTYTYTLTCTNEGGTTSQSATLSVVQFQSPPETPHCSLGASPSSVTPGEVVKISGEADGGFYTRYVWCDPANRALLWGKPENVLAVKWSLDNTSYSNTTGFSLTLEGREGFFEASGTTCDVPSPQPNYYNITSFDINTTGLSQGTHTVYLEVEDATAGNGYCQVSFQVTAAGTIKVESNKETDWSLIYVFTDEEIDPETAKKLSKTYENQKTGGWEILPDDIPNNILSVTCDPGPCITGSWIGNLETGKTLTFNLNYTLITYTLTVSKTGTGSGTVTSSPAGINCGTDCSETYNSGTSVTLTATPDSGSTFTGWSGDCSGTGTCTLIIDSNKSATAKFDITNNRPSAINLSVTQGDYCQFYSPPIFLSWQFSDPDPGDSQSAYQVQVDNNSDFTSPEKDSGKVISSSNSYAPIDLSYNTTYNWQLKVWDSKDTSSGWATGSSFTTPKNPYPRPDFSWSPENPRVNQFVQFTDLSQAFGGASISQWFWTFQDGNPSTSSSQNPKIKFLSQGSKQVTLTVIDSSGYSCSLQKTVPVERISFWEWWKEIIPF